MHDTQNDNFIGKAIGLVVVPSDIKGFGFIKPYKKMVEHGNGYAYVDFTEDEKRFYLNKDAFAHYKNIIGTPEGQKIKLDGDEVVEFELYYSGKKKGPYATNIRKVDSIFDENGYIKDLSNYGIHQIKSGNSNI